MHIEEKHMKTELVLISDCRNSEIKTHVCLSLSLSLSVCGSVWVCVCVRESERERRRRGSDLGVLRKAGSTKGLRLRGAFKGPLSRKTGPHESRGPVRTCVCVCVCVCVCMCPPPTPAAVTPSPAGGSSGGGDRSG